MIDPAAWDAATDPSLPEGTAEVNGQRFGWVSLGDPPPGEAEGWLVPPVFASAIMNVSQELLDDSAGMGDIGEWLGKAMRGEIEPRPPRKPERHRCLACWLVSLLPGHDRCQHGYLTGCEECEEW